MNKGFPKFDFEHYFKRLIVLNHHGIYLYFRDGHTWITIAPNEEQDVCVPEDNFIYQTLKSGRVYCNDKIYGGILEAIDTLDSALQLAGAEPLIDWYDEDWMVMGNGGVDVSRISRVETGGGLM